MSTKKTMYEHYKKNIKKDCFFHLIFNKMGNNVLFIYVRIVKKN